MKFFCQLLCVYMLFLSAYPCADFDECSSITQSTMNKKIHHSSHEDENESCSPLCNCECCGILLNFNVVKEYNFLNEIYAHYNSPQFIFKVNYIPQNFYSIWQPPKIC